MIEFPLLAIDTASSVGFVSVWKNKEEFFSCKIEDIDSHNEKLASTTSSLLSKASIKMKDIRTFFFGGGPGSFTGLRIGAAFISGCITSGYSNAKLYTEDSFSVICEGLFTTDPLLEKVIVASDARRDELYAFGREKNGKVVYPLGIYPQSFIKEATVTPSSISIEVFEAGVLKILNTKIHLMTVYTSDIIGTLELFYLREVAAKTILERNEQNALKDLI